MLKEPNPQELQQKLYERLKPSGWADLLKGFILSDEMIMILKQLILESKQGDKFTPKLKQVFRFLEECPYAKLKVIIILQDPYAFMDEYGETIADGIPMSCGNTLKVQPSLRFVHQSIQETVYKDKPYNNPRDLKVWANQGVLLLNAALTTTIGKTGVHYLLWRPFVVYLLDTIGWNKPGLVYIYMGQKAKEYMKITPNNTYKFTVVHPAYAAHKHLDSWDCQDIWRHTNLILQEKEGKEPIKW